jgi:predicted metal-dependent phosphoesterase TrpH
MAFTIDFHVHTYHSFDSLNRPAVILKKARQAGLDAIVVLDHDSVQGGVETASLADNEIVVIPAIEVKTDIGDIIGLFMRNDINESEYHKVIEHIRRQNGLVMLPHPYHGHRLNDDLFELVDLIEINNARLTADKNAMAKKLAEKYKIAAVSGSDAHFAWEIGRSVTMFENTPSSRDELIDMILNGKRTHKIRLTSQWNIILSQLLKYIKNPKSFFKRIGLTKT